MRAHSLVTGLFLLTALAAQGAGWNGVILDTAQGKRLSREELFDALSGMEYVALGEKHYTPEIQKAQAMVITGVIKQAKKEKRFTVGWEFLYRKDREENRKRFDRYVGGEMTAVEFLKETQGNAEAASYAPILEAAKDLGGELLGLNLTREEKRPAVKGGLAAMDPALVPPKFKLGSDAYFARFAEALGADPHGMQIKNYFVAQCLTDAWLAQTLASEAKGDVRFLIAGSFHVDYGEGAVRELRERGSARFTRAVSIVDASDYAEKELETLSTHPKYGKLADYVIYVNEPKP